ncbi:unnamed protein product, partial [Didymodactylos carnosus]
MNILEQTQVLHSDAFLDE